MTRTQTPAELRRSYECIYLIRGDLDEAAVDTTITKYTNLLKEQGAKVVGIDNWGLRRTAYLINKQAKSTYIYTQFFATADVVAETERQMRIDDNVVRWLNVILDDHADPASRPEATEVKKHTVEEPSFGEAAEGRRPETKGEDRE